MELYSLEETGRDELNNPIKKPILIGLYKGAITQWTTEEIALLDRKITSTQRKFITDAPRNVIEHADQVQVDGDTYTLLNLKTDYRRWRLCHVRGIFT